MVALGVKSKTEAARIAIRWVPGLDRPDDLTPDVAKNRKTKRWKTKVKD
jgi:hypothetical protein